MGIWKGIALAGLLHGSEVLNWTKEDLNKLEVIQNRVGRIGLGANMMVGIEAIRGDMGLSLFEETIFKGTLKFKIRREKWEKIDGLRRFTWIMGHGVNGTYSLIGL